MIIAKLPDLNSNLWKESKQTTNIASLFCDIHHYHYYQMESGLATLVCKANYNLSYYDTHYLRKLRR